MARKFLLVGLFVVYERGTIEQIAIGTIVAAAYLCAHRTATPDAAAPLHWRPRPPRAPRLARCCAG